MSTWDYSVKNPKEAERLKKIDFKMVSFTLAGKDYGIDILKVKEIRKAGNFTFVPNTPLYVRGVDNLRGDIIPIIDLRIMFNLPAETSIPGTLENIIILRLDELVIGVVVDTIEKVIGISSETIQPPHPLFGDINVKYISGVVENDSRLYIILDVDRIFGSKNNEAPPSASASSAASESASVGDSIAETAPVPSPLRNASQAGLDVTFISETLSAFAGFHVTDINRDWVTARTSDWKKECEAKGQDFQISSKAEAETFLQPFFSPFTAKLWDETTLHELATRLSWEGNPIIVWNPGCGQGHESYSLALMFAVNCPDKNYKVWANDSDLFNISSAPTLILSEDEVFDSFKPFTVQTKSGLQFSTELKAHIMFEFHDINHMNPFTDVHLIVARDVISFLKPIEQEKILGDFYDKLRPGGYLVLGKNERLPQGVDWVRHDLDELIVYQKAS